MRLVHSAKGLVHGVAYFFAGVTCLDVTRIGSHMRRTTQGKLYIAFPVFYCERRARNEDVGVLEFTEDFDRRTRCTRLVGLSV